MSTIDIALHTASFPASYTGPGTLIGNPRLSEPSATLALYWTGDGTTLTIPLGDEPLKVEVIDTTNNIVWTWLRGMAATKCFKSVAAGTQTIDTTSAIVAAAVDGSLGNFTLTLSSGLNAAAAALVAAIKL
jgi:hypothetical protein